MEPEFHRIRRLPPYVFAEANGLNSEARAAGEAIADFGRRHEIDVVSDVACAEVYFDGPPPPSILQAPGAKKVAVWPGMGCGEYGDGQVRFTLVEKEHLTRQIISDIREIFQFSDNLLDDLDKRKMAS